MKTLTKQEQADFDRLHIIVNKWLDGWEAVAQALIEIRDRQLYRRSYATFEEYCKAEFSFGKRRSYQLMQAFEVKKIIATHDPEAAKLLDRPSKVEAIKNQPLAKAVKSLRKAAKTGKVTAKTIKIAATGKESATETLAKIVTRLEWLKSEKVSWDGASAILDRIVEVVQDLKAIAQEKHQRKGVR